MTSKNLHIDSLVIHGGQKPDPTTGAVMPPISVASTYAQTSPGEHTGFVYSRTHNPTRFALERAIAILEGSTLSEKEDITLGGFAFASGMAATSVLFELIDAGDEVVAMDDLYGGTYRLITNVRERSQGLKVKYVDMSNLDEVRKAITDKTRMIWVESPTNPLLKIADLKGIVEIAKGKNIITVCDNTFATPMLQRPLELGFDLVLHSATKYLGGHSDVVGGVVATSRADLAERIRFLQKSIGSILSPFDSYFILRGIKTLALRMRHLCSSAQQIAAWLEAHPKVERVAYPCLDSHPHHNLASKQMQLDGKSSGGGMITAWLKADLAKSRKFLESLELFTLAESLGGVESLIEHPAIMTHASVPPKQREALGIGDNMVRLSIGIEHIDDLKADLEQALTAV